MYNQMVHEFCSARGILLVYGTSKNKVDAINRDMDAFSKPHWDILVNMSDDMEFTYKGFDIDIRKEFYGRSFPAATWVEVRRLYLPSFVVEIELTAKNLK
jgi:enamine deaminase RidA (YjgF/YER057c/UK114 family)